MEKQFDFEKELNKLEEISTKLENKSLSIDESIKLYEEGMTISKKLLKVMQDAKEKVEVAIKENEK